MRNPEFLDEIMPDDFIERIEAVAGASTDNFGELVKISELSPGTAFRYADLEGVDFSNTDISGFDFTGANLRETVGVNVSWDASTCLNGADIDGGFFAHGVRLDRQFRDSEEAQREFSRVINFDVYEKSFWLTEVAGEIDRSRGKTIAALKLFDEVSNITVRNTFIYNAIRMFDDRESYRDFLTSLFARRGIDDSSYRACLTVLAKAFNNDDVVQKILFLVLQYGRNSHRMIAASGLVNARNFESIHADILNVMNSQRLLEFRSYVIATAIEKSSRVRRSFFFRADQRDYFKSLGLEVAGIDFAIPISETSLIDTMLAYLVSNFDEAKAAAEIRDFRDQGATHPRQLVSAVRILRRNRRNDPERAGLSRHVSQMVWSAGKLRDDLEAFYIASGVTYDFRGSLAQELSLSRFNAPSSPDVEFAEETFDVLMEIYS